MHLQEISNVIRERRTLLGITQQDLSDISGVGLRTIKEVEAAKGNPAIQTLLKLLDVLGMELDVKIRKTVE